MNDADDEIIRALYKQSHQEQPSEFLDKRIRKAAQRALSQNRRRWIWGLSTAAVMVLSFNIVLDLFINKPELTESYVDDISIEFPKTLKKESIQSQIRQLAEPPATILSDMPANAPKLTPEASEAFAMEEEQLLLLESQPEKSNQLNRVQKKRKSFTQGIINLEQESYENQDLQDSVAREQSFQKSIILESKTRKPKVHKINTAREKDEDGIQSAPLTSLIQTATEIPELPLKLDELLNIDHSLKGEKSTNGDILIYFEKKVIIRLSHLGSTIQFTAWQGSEIMGLKLDWLLTPEQLSECSIVADQKESSICSLTDQVKAHFRDNKLEFITWVSSGER